MRVLADAIMEAHGIGDKIVKLDAPWFGDLPPDQVLEVAKGKLESVLIVGIEKGEGDEPKRYYASSTHLSLGDVIYEMELFKHKIMAGDFG